MLFAFSPWEGCAGDSAAGLGLGDHALISAQSKPCWAPPGGWDVPLHPCLSPVGATGATVELKRGVREVTTCASAVFTHISSQHWLPAQVSPRCPRAAPACCNTAMASVPLLQAWRALVLRK